MKSIYKVFSFFLTIPIIIFFSIFTISNSDLAFISFWPLENKILLPIWALSLFFFFGGLFFGCILIIFKNIINYLNKVK